MKFFIMYFSGLPETCPREQTVALRCSHRRPVRGQEPGVHVPPGVRLQRLGQGRQGPSCPLRNASHGLCLTSKLFHLNCVYDTTSFFTKKKLYMKNLNIKNKDTTWLFFLLVELLRSMICSIEPA